MARDKKRVDPEDDGRTIVNMNVDGMPWYDPRIGSGGDEGNTPKTPMSKEEQRMFTWAAIKAGLLVALVFAVVFGLFIAFCDFIWFR